MIRLRGTYQYTKQRDYDTAYTYFLFLPEDRSFPCTYGKYIGVKGKIQECPKGTPLEIECETETSQNGKLQYVLTSYRFTQHIPEEVPEFLQSILLREFTENRIKKIKEAELDLFSFEKEEENKKKLKTLRFTEDEIGQILTRALEMVSIKEMFDELTKYGVKFSTVKAIANAYEENQGLERIKKKPYSMMKFGVPFNVCENIAISLGGGQFDTARLDALTRGAFELCTRSGHTKATLSAISDAAAYLEKSVNHGWRTSVFFLTKSLLKDDYLIKKEPDGWFIYSANSYRMETAIAGNAKRLSQAPIKTYAPELIEKAIKEAEEMFNISYSAQQREAFSMVLSPGLKILTGGPGTGKTTTVKGLIHAKKMLCPNAEVLLCAPTATAARRAAEAAGMHATTIHRMLDIRPIGDRLIQMRDENNRLSADLVIVDEVSMVDTEVFHMLIRAVKSTATVLLIGDENQLPSVGAGNILHDLISFGRLQMCRLTQVYRQADDSLIIANSIRICAGNPALVAGNDYELIPCRTEAEMKEALYNKMEEYYDPVDPSRTKVFSPIRKVRYELGTWAINAEMHRKYHKKEEMEYCYNFQTFAKGDPVIFTRNNYASGYCNGDTGLITGILEEENGKKGLLIKTSDDELLITGADMADVELAYAVTTHKAQGGECDTAIILLPEEPKNMLTRNLIYVAATRARKKCIIIYEDGALQYGIKNNFQTKRLTGLKARLDESL